MLITSRRNTSVELSNSEMPLRSSENPQKMSSSHQIHRTTTRPTFTFSQGSPIISATGYDEDDDDEDDDDDDEEFMNSPLHMRNWRQSRSSGSIKRRGSSHKLIQTDGAQGPNRRSSNDSQVQMRHHSRTSSAGSSQNVIVHHYHHHHHSIDSPPPYSSARGPSNGSETSLISSDYCTDPNPVQLWNRAGSVSSQSSDQSPVRPPVAGGGTHLQNPTVISNAASTTGSSSSTQTFFPPHASASSPSLSTLVSPASPPNAYPLSSRFPPNSQQTTAHLRQHSMSHVHGAPNDTHVLTSSRSFSVAAHSSQAQIQAQIQQQQLLQNRAQMSKNNNNNNNQQPFRTSASSSNLAVMNQNASSTSADTSRERLRRRTMSDPVSRNPKRSVKRPLRILGLKMFNARFHFLLGLSRFLSVLPSIIGAWSCLYDAYTIRSSALSVSILASSLPSIIAAAAAAAAAAASESSSSSSSSFSSNIHATETVIVSSPYPSSTDSIFESENIASSSSSKQPPFAFPFQKSKPPTQISTSSLLLAALNNNKVNSNDQINADLLTSFLLNPNLYSSQHQSSSSSSSNKDNLYPISHHLNAILANSDENIKTIQKNIKNIVAFATVRCSELIMASIWCVVAGYLSYSVLDGLMDRWLLIYSTPAVIIRLLSSSVLNFLMVHALISIFSPDTTYRLHVWILISCILTVCYTIQNFLTSNVGVVVEDDSRPSKSNAAPVVQKRPRSVDLYNIAVFAVVPVGLASFITMVGMLRSIMVLQYQYESLDISFITAPATAIIP